MSSLLPVAVYGLKVPAGDVMIPAATDFAAAFRITMAAIDPSANPEQTGNTNGDIKPRATLKIVYDRNGPDDEDSEDSDDPDASDYLKALLAGQPSDDEEDDEESSSDDEEKNGGPSDPSKSKKARKEAAVQQMLQALAQSNDSDAEDDMEIDNVGGVNGLAKKSKLNKGKGKATAGDLEDEDDNSEEDDEDDDEMDEVVICTLDPEKNYQQTLDITIPEDQRAYFKVSGTHAIYLTGNYVIPANDGPRGAPGLYDSEDEEEGDEYDMSPDEDELLDDEESDDLDGLEDPRITELDSEEEEEVPKLVKKSESAQKGKNKRPAEDSDDEKPTLDAIMAKSLKPAETATNGESKLSKKQLKKLKNNDGKAVKAEDAGAKGDKKVSFAKELEQGPTSSPANGSTETKASKDSGKQKANLGVKMVQGVKVDDKTLGKGPAAKKGDKVGMRYIGKLSNGKVFDANKKGKPFSFKLGQGQVIKGWDIGVAGMSVGGERRITIPANLAYGSKGTAGIPGNSELTFDLKLLEIN